MVSLRGVICNFKYIALVITGALAFVGGTDDTAPQYVLDYTVNASIDNSDYYLWTIEELGDIIVSAGTFWNDWWYGDWQYGRGTFSAIVVDPYAPIPEHFPGSIYLAVLPNPKFESLNDIRNYLLQFYTERWVDSVINQEMFPFVEYTGVLYMHIARAGLARPGWHTASHVLIGQIGNAAIVETTIYQGFWCRLESGGHVLPIERTHRFTLINGRIDTASANVMLGGISGENTETNIGASTYYDWAIEELGEINENWDPQTQLQLFYSDDELAEAVLDFLATENFRNHPIFWWLRGSNIGVDYYARGLAISESEYFQPVRRFSSIFEMKTATEQMVSSRFAEEHLYYVLLSDGSRPRRFLEYDGQLFYNTILNGGWMFPDPIYGSIIYRSDYEVKIEVTHEWWRSAFFYNDMHQFEVYLVRLISEDGFWKIDTWPGRTFNNPFIRSFT